MSEDCMPDRNCVSLPDGSCVGRDCMHDTESPYNPIQWGVWREDVHQDEGGEG